jgi:D-lyxose ketol-isomerase
MKRSEINSAIRYAAEVMTENHFYLPEWSEWTPEEWTSKGEECSEIWNNGLGWDVTDFATGDFEKIGLTAVTIRNGNVALDKKPYCEKIMIVRENQVTPIHFHWKKMEDIINRGGGDLCIKIWPSNLDEELLMDDCQVKIDGIWRTFKAGETFRLKPGQSISFTPYIYHTFWAEGGTCLAGEVSTVNDDANDNRFYEPLGRYTELVEDEPVYRYLCNEYPNLKK